ncbi:MAG: enoyl-CoA hydratase/isomerase family protein [Actinomycetota bacterium]|nr:enoyl-CoA hydratase/isomerase family protein [Actinomycetota bacterium]
MTTLDDYRDSYDYIAVDRTDDGVLTLRMHYRNRSLLWAGGPHRELPELFAAIAADRDNRVVIITGTGDSFIDFHEEGAAAMADEGVPAGAWDRVLWEGKRLVMNFLDIDVPVIAAVNGPARAHSELAILADVVLAADHAVFSDRPHFTNGLVPGDSMQIIWPLLLGHNRGRHFLLTGQEITAQHAMDLGVVGEVLPAEALMDRANEIAHMLAAKDVHLLRFTRHVLTHRLKKAMLEELEMGLALEGLAAASHRN